MSARHLQSLNRHRMWRLMASVILISTLAAVMACSRLGKDRDSYSGSANSSTRPELVPQIGHRGPLFAVTFSSDGKLLASGGEDGVIRFWEPQTGGLKRTLIGCDSSVT
ncbi:MAG: WD40 repeat domain-containing protein, partial [Terriglobia bacterium]